MINKFSDKTRELEKNSRDDRGSIKKVRKILEKQHYSLVGNTSAVQICRWTKNSLNKRGVCWKEKFYGIKSSQCCQFSPAVMWCDNQCLHCWRPIEMNLGTEISEIDDPKQIIDGIVEARKKLLIGFKGNAKVSEKEFKESLEPKLFTMSLSGEATLYPRIGELIKEIRKRKAVSFLVTNGLHPDVLMKLAKENSLPTQLTVSTNAPNEELFNLWHRSSRKDAWKKFNETLNVVRKLKGKTRRVIRLTLVKKGQEKGRFKELSNMEDNNIPEYAELIKKAEPDFIHVKGFMSVGYARDRMGYDKQPWHKDVKEFSEKLILKLGDKWKILGEEERSCVVLLGKNKKDLKIRNV